MKDKTSDERSSFPEDFLWGSATAAYQVEGNNIYNDWWQWERSSKRKKSLKLAGKNPEDYFSGIACDHYRRYPEDLKLLADSGQNAYRFSIEWSRIEPSPGKFSDKEICHYKKLIEHCLELEVKPVITLWHFTSPQWLAEIGGWENPQVSDFFARYVKAIIKELGELCDLWFTLNEPNMYVLQSFLLGVWPPQKKNPISAYLVEKNLLVAHLKAYEVIRRHQPEAKIGLTYAFPDIKPASTSWLDRKLSQLLDYLINFRFIDKIKGYLDLIGVQYYTAVEIGPGKIKDYVGLMKEQYYAALGIGLNQKNSSRKSDMGWVIYPKGIYDVLKKVWSRYHLPIMITENGIADARDTKRPKFILDHLYWVKRAIEEGVDVRGYFHWSLMDNFEWAFGFWPRFGLIEIDRKTLERKPRKSFYLYSKICRSNGRILNKQSAKV